jgi:bifunctional non-homologous end joining protein LigD
VSPSPSARTTTETEVDGRRLTLSNLDKVLYPETGFTKADVISYYLHISPVMLAHLAGRPATFIRFPNGVDGGSFFEKHRPKAAPDWVQTVRVPRSAKADERNEIEQVVIADRPTIVWAANLAALELHVPMWRSQADGSFGDFDEMVFDLDPGAPADIVACCLVAEMLREELAERGLVPYPKTSGSKGMQLYVPLDPPRPSAEVHEESHEIAALLESRRPDLVVSRMSKELRTGKIFIDWSQNHPAKTTIAPYSLRARARPTVSTPVTWEEVDACAGSGLPQSLSFTAPEVLQRVEERGDLYAPLVAATP